MCHLRAIAALREPTDFQCYAAGAKCRDIDPSECIKLLKLLTLCPGQSSWIIHARTGSSHRFRTDTVVSCREMLPSRYRKLAGISNSQDPIYAAERRVTRNFLRFRSACQRSC